MKPELRKMAEEAFGPTGLVNYWEIGDVDLEAFARLIAADCANLCHDQGTGQFSHAYVADACRDAILAKYGA